MRAIAAAVLTAAVLISSSDAVAQESSPVTGRVIARSADAIATGPGVPGAAVTFEQSGLRAETDSAGRFAFPAVPAGTHVLTVSVIGWKTSSVVIRVPVERPLVIEIDPDAVALEPIEAAAVGMLRQRREAVPHTSRSFGRAELAEVGNFMIDALRSHGVRIEDCTGRAELHCVNIRGAASRPTVCINDMPAMDGLAELARYPAESLQLVEVYGAGRMIRAYTRDYMDRVRAGEVYLGAIDMNLRRC